MRGMFCFNFLLTWQLSLFCGNGAVVINSTLRALLFKINICYVCSGLTGLFVYLSRILFIIASRQLFALCLLTIRIEQFF
jgi:hypothetical protein